jgi:hypothetical protein
MTISIGPPFCFAGFGTDRLRCEEAMKTAGRENPNRWTKASSKSSTWRGSSEQILLHQIGCEARKSPAGVGVFFLTFLFIELTRHAGTANRSASHIRHTKLWVGLWVGNF